MGLVIRHVPLDSQMPTGAAMLAGKVVVGLLWGSLSSLPQRGHGQSPRTSASAGNQKDMPVVLCSV